MDKRCIFFTLYKRFNLPNSTKIKTQQLDYRENEETHEKLKPKALAITKSHPQSMETWHNDSSHCWDQHKSTEKGTPENTSARAYTQSNENRPEGKTSSERNHSHGRANRSTGPDMIDCLKTPRGVGARRTDQGERGNAFAALKRSVSVSSVPRHSWAGEGEGCAGGINVRERGREREEWELRMTASRGELCNA